MDAAHDDVSVMMGEHKRQKRPAQSTSVGSHKPIQKNLNEHISKSMIATTSDEYMAYSQESVE